MRAGEFISRSFPTFRRRGEEGRGGYQGGTANLAQGRPGGTYRIRALETRDEAMESFLFSLGCYPGEAVTVISRLAENYIISIKDSRYSIDGDLARAILLD